MPISINELDASIKTLLADLTNQLKNTLCHHESYRHLDAIDKRDLIENTLIQLTINLLQDIAYQADDSFELILREHVAALVCKVQHETNGLFEYPAEKTIEFPRIH